MRERQVVIAGGGAAGFFAAITCAEAAPKARVTILESSPAWLSKVRISGGGRCNVTHACYEPRELSGYYPRGGSALVGPFQRFQPRDTMAWFEGRGVALKVEEDGRMFPVSNTSQTIIECLVGAVRAAGVRLMLNAALVEAKARAGGGFELRLRNGEAMECDRLMLATGGCRAPAAGALAVSLGHTLEAPVPSLFTFHLAEDWVRELAGISVPAAEVSVPGTDLKAKGALLCTHAGVSGPAVLRLSAWGARKLHASNYQFKLRVKWLPELDEQAVLEQLERCRRTSPARLLANTPLAPLPLRLWQSLQAVAGIRRETKWAELANTDRHRLVQQLLRTELSVTGKTLNQDEFVTCGGVRLKEVNFRTMESRVCPGLFFGGELLDIDGLTGGFNFQAAWTTGWIAGKAMAKEVSI
jgi:predicted Rossmann fold flavoprotein